MPVGILGLLLMVGDSGAQASRSERAPQVHVISGLKRHSTQTVQLEGDLPWRERNESVGSGSSFQNHGNYPQARILRVSEPLGIGTVCRKSALISSTAHRPPRFPLTCEGANLPGLNDAGGSGLLPSRLQENLC